VEVPLRSLFASPTVEALAQVIEEAKRKESGVNKMPTLVSRRYRSEEDVVELAYAQQRMWFLHELEPESAAYNIASAVQLSGQLNLSALEQAFSEVVRRHEVLRTTFITVKGQPRQVVGQPGIESLSIKDLSCLPSLTQRKLVERLALEEAQRPFSLACGPLLRLQVLRFEKEEHLLLFTVHHIVSDEWSMNAFIRELTSIYHKYAEGQPSALTEVSIQYADFAIWQREVIRGEFLENQLAYWKKQLSGPLSVLDLPIDRPRPLTKGGRGAAHSFKISTLLFAALKRFSRQQNATVYMTLLAAYKAVLHRYSGQTDIIVGSPVANRGQIETENLIGCLINTLALRTYLSGNPNFVELLRRVRAVVLDAHEHQDVPYELVVEAVRPESQGRSTSLFRVWFLFQIGSRERLESAGLVIKPSKVENGTTQFDIVLSMAEDGDEIVGEWRYDKDLFEPTTIEEMSNTFIKLLEKITDDATDCGILDIVLSETDVSQNGYDNHDENLVWTATLEREDQYLL
jgi:hypothetical protein